MRNGALLKPARRLRQTSPSAPGSKASDPREHEPENQAHAQVASTSVFAGALTACLGSRAEPLARRVVTTRDGVAQLKRDALGLTGNGHGRDVSSVVCTGSPAGPG